MTFLHQATRALLLIALAILLAGGLCESGTEEPDEEERTAAERLQQPRNVYDGNVNENLRELRDDLEEAGSDRQRLQESQIHEATEP